MTDQLNATIEMYEQNNMTTEAQQLAGLKAQLDQAAQSFAQQFGTQMNTSQALFNLFYKNKAFHSLPQLLS